MVSLIILATYTLSSFFCCLLLVIHRDASLIVSGLTLSLFVMYLLYLSLMYYFFYLSLLLSYLLYLLYFYCYLLFLIHYILSIIITKAALLASLYPGLPKQLYKIMMDLGNRLMMIHFYRIVFFRDFDKKISFIYKKVFVVNVKGRRQPKPPPDFLFIFTIIIYAVYFA